MRDLHQFFINQPLLALFITISLGYFVGKFRIKQFKLGGIAGSLLIGVLIGQLGIKIPEIIGTIFFALFIYAVGYQGGPQFFRSLNRQTLVELISATVTCLLGLLCVLIAAKIYHLDRGTAAGLAAGGLTQSAIIGTAGDAIAKLDVTPEVKHLLQSNVAVGYAVCYIFGSFGPILLLATVFPGMMGWNLRREAQLLAAHDKSSAELLEPGQFQALTELRTRVYQVAPESQLIGLSVDQVSKAYDMAIEALQRNGQNLEIKPGTKIASNDVIAITARVQDFVKQGALVGEEIQKPQDMKVIEEQAKVIINNQHIDKKTVADVLAELKQSATVFITSIIRLGERVNATPNVPLQQGDELTLVGKSDDVNKAANALGYKITQDNLTDFIFFGLGMSVGILLGMVSFTLSGVNVTLGSGVGCLFSGLVFGWLRSTHPRYAALPSGASNFLRDFGLAVFVSVIGITAGPQAIETIKQYGLELFFLGVGVTLIPQIIAFYFSYYVLKIKNPITLLATIAGGRSANPGFAALLEKAGNSTPVVPFTATYAIANILLTLWGPIIIGIINVNPT